jgi:hypothetical protein
VEEGLGDDWCGVEAARRNPRRRKRSEHDAGIGTGCGFIAAAEAKTITAPVSWAGLLCLFGPRTGWSARLFGFA